MYRYLHLDVFTDRALSGNQLAVFPDAHGLDTPTMQAIALEMAFSETTFVFPAERPDTDFRVRIFTPRSELPMAGHPTIGTTFGLAHEGRIHHRCPAVRLGLSIGPTPVALEWSADRLRFAWMTQRLPEFGPALSDAGRMAVALGIPEEEIQRTNLPIQVVDCGLRFLLVPLMSRRAVDQAELDRNAFRRFCGVAGIDETGLYIFSFEPADDDDVIAYARMLAPGFGIIEDPATGGACGPLGSYLVHHAVVGPAKASHIVSLQVSKWAGPAVFTSQSTLRGAQSPGFELEVRRSSSGKGIFKSEFRADTESTA